MTIQEYVNRRKRLAKLLPKNSIAIIPAASEVIRNGDVHYRFRQDSDFFYLTGFDEPDSLLVLLSAPNEQSILFCKNKNPQEELWSGSRLGPEVACETLAINHAYSLDELNIKLPALLFDIENIYFPIKRYPFWDKKIMGMWSELKTHLRRGELIPNTFADITAILGEMRLFKSDFELDCLRRAISISATAHEYILSQCLNATYEYELEAFFRFELLRSGIQEVAYEPIIASGKNACTLHYIANNEPIAKDELILIDAGGAYQHYCADITRTFPANGEFSPEQRALYELVLSAQTAAIQLIKPGVSWDSMQQAIVRILTQGLVSLGILKGSVDSLIEQESYKAFYMHQSGHWLGLDVHDAGKYRIDQAYRHLEAGMVLTVEPGLYIAPDSPNVDPRFRGIGIRIEDDILVTEHGHENLSKQLPTDIETIEALIRG